MRTARVAHAGAIHTAAPHEHGLRLADGRVLAEDAVVWLPPVEVGTVIALGLNYADHVKELAAELTVTSRDEPLVFFKTPGALIGHRGFTRRPQGVQFMHYECELAVVIGRTAKRVKAVDAMQHVAGYTVCNGYAIASGSIRNHLPEPIVKAFGIAYWIGTTTATGMIRRPTRRRAFAGSLRKRAS